MEPIVQSMKAKPNYQLMPKGTSLIELPLTQLYVWYTIRLTSCQYQNGEQLSQLRPAEVKEFQAWCLWAENWRQKYGEWAVIPVIESL